MPCTSPEPLKPFQILWLLLLKVNYEAGEKEQKKLENGSFSKHPSLLSHRNPKRKKREERR
jgi:hypothetical protein